MGPADLAWALLPGVFFALGALDPHSYFLYTALPFSVGIGVLLVLYAATLRARLPGAATPMPSEQRVARAFTAVVVGVSLFWGTSHYATTEGHRLADAFDPADRPRVVVFSPTRLNLTVPGVDERRSAGRATRSDTATAVCASSNGPAAVTFSSPTGGRRKPASS